MTQIRLRFYEELNDFITPALRKVEIVHVFFRKASIKDIIESFGVPHTEVELILVNGISVNFAYTVKDGDRISVYPKFESFDITPILRLRPKPLRLPKFVIDANLGRLTRYLRLLGFDCLYSNAYDDATVATISSEKNRIVLTRDRRLLQRKIITHGYFVREVTPKLQVKEVLKRFDLYRLITPFTRCMHCNGILENIEKQQIKEHLKPLTKMHYDNFLVCSGCKQIYWQGSHYKRAKQLIDEFMQISG
ncbi:twitching motility protein PilT [Methyloprofundus sedimenti]|uniref:Twitching motility protein PilT n=1 Tax=Methyloprofundus sedimenti TaxID=1420851 RepID=A0A1V8M850_9GAMM|nr:Mut7-C RNAse domain-containing protein [Methyloprofundus sedimenti]OQK17709.1 twitching motility protein PilT [Methyloprofundus sedimenti]